LWQKLGQVLFWFSAAAATAAVHRRRRKITLGYRG